MVHIPLYTYISFIPTRLWRVMSEYVVVLAPFFRVC